MATLLKDLRLRGILSHPRRWMQLLPAVSNLLLCLITHFQQRHIDCFELISCTCQIYYAAKPPRLMMVV